MDLLEVISNIKNKLEESLNIVKNKMNIQFEVPEILVNINSQRIYGDLSTNLSMTCCKYFKLSPQKVAQLIIENIKCDQWINKCEVAGNGFINFFLSDLFFDCVLREINEKGDNYGKLNYGLNKKVLVEFVSSNPTGPMHIGNARLGAVGDSLAEILKFAGYNVSKEFYVNDAGNQIKKFSESLSSRYIQIYDPNEKFPEDGYHGDDIKQLALQFANIYGNSFINDRELLQKKIVDYALPLNIDKIKSTLLDYKINYDNWFYESSLYSSGEIGEIVDFFKNKGVTYEKDDALWFRATEFGCEKDEVLIKNNKIPTYYTADIAYHANKFLKRKFDICIDFLGADHHGHIPRMRAAMKCLGIDDSRLIFIISQFVRLVKNGSLYSMSKRSGNSETLDSFLKVVKVDCARFIFNMQDPNSTMDFDLDLAVKNDNSNPSYYVKYAYARIQSILRSFTDKEKISKDLHLNLLNSDIEIELIFCLSMFPLEIRECAKNFDSTKLTKYAIRLASLFHKFYNSNRVNCSDKNLSGARYFLCLQTATIIKSTLKLVKIDTPDYM